MQEHEREELEECANQGCCCAVVREERELTSAPGHYCSEECAGGKGCEHVSCACGAAFDA